MKPYYEHGGISIFHADWREVGLSQMERRNLLLTDPPYGIGEAAGKNRSRSKAFGSASHAPHNTKGRIIPSTDYGNLKWDNEPPSDIDIQLLRDISEIQIIFGGNYFPLPPSSCWLVWDKDNSGDFADCELAWTNMPKAVRKFRWRWNGMLQEDMANKELRVHPTQKPLAVMKWALSQAPQGVRTVIDPYMGSGTTLVACKAAGLECIGIEREEQYCEAAATRLMQGVLEFA